jgi:eukaryotic-like serine/threonine-protein kinase
MEIAPPQIRQAAPIPLRHEVLREQVGDLLGPYELSEVAGEGSMGKVFRARHLTLSRQVAIKVLKPEYARSPEQLGRFVQEAQAVHTLNHPNIVGVLDFVQDVRADGVPRAYCVMEWLEGKTLAVMLARRQLPVARLAEIAQQVCSALEAAHQLGVIHRDVKPDNLVVAREADGRDLAKVLDFGVAKLLAPRLVACSGDM